MHLENWQPLWRLLNSKCVEYFVFLLNFHVSSNTSYFKCFICYFLPFYFKYIKNGIVSENFQLGAIVQQEEAEEVCILSVYGG